MKCKICLIVVIFNAVFASGITINLLFPKGFSIRENKVGNSRSANFEVTITRNDGNLLIASYHKRVRYAFLNQWTFMKRNIALNIGDVISYKVSTDGDNSPIKIEGGSCRIKELPELGKLRRHGIIMNYDIQLSENDCTTENEVSPPLALEAVTTESVETINNDMKQKLNECKQSMFNASLSLLSLQMEVEELRNKTHQLTDFEETYPLAKQLTLSGRIPPEGNATEIVQFMLSEKLDLKPNIVSAFRDSPYSIIFTVSTVVEKFQILEVAKFILAESKIKIT